MLAQVSLPWNVSYTDFSHSCQIPALVTCAANQSEILGLCFVLINSILHPHPLVPKALELVSWPSAWLPSTWWFIACSGIPITVFWHHFRTQITPFYVFDATSLFGCVVFSVLALLATMLFCQLQLGLTPVPVLSHCQSVVHNLSVNTCNSACHSYRNYTGHIRGCTDGND